MLKKKCVIIFTKFILGSTNGIKNPHKQLWQESASKFPATFANYAALTS